MDESQNPENTAPPPAPESWSSKGPIYDPARQPVENQATPITQVEAELHNNLTPTDPLRIPEFKTIDGDELPPLEPILSVADPMAQKIEVGKHDVINKRKPVKDVLKGLLILFGLATATGKIVEAVTPPPPPHYAPLRSTNPATVGADTLAAQSDELSRRINTSAIPVGNASSVVTTQVSK
jgi:hypothetical protein